MLPKVPPTPWYGQKIYIEHIKQARKENHDNNNSMPTSRPKPRIKTSMRRAGAWTWTMQAVVAVVAAPSRLAEVPQVHQAHHQRRIPAEHSTGYIVVVDLPPIL